MQCSSEPAIVSLRKIDARLSGATNTGQVTTSPNRYRTTIGA
ncbi:hypothetical protein AVDCRST_MAG84-2475 [uncultured Microcoleus sp.]|uniref:Uncharacterized protein n=1 Tax=uncultured Microcoleus sp. TaxID=259945 RepID=A0A6J4LV81_9CYAN|nr:hypothetical protein AVDCRST_MAG84-2475 [uncultured Microcoleus sp.]